MTQSSGSRRKTDRRRKRRSPGGDERGDSPLTQAHDHRSSGTAQRVIAQAQKGALLCIDAARGRKLWETDLGRGEAEHYRLLDLTGSPTVVNGKIYAGSTNGNLYCVDLETGDILWTYAAEAAVIGRPYFQDGRVFVLALNGGHAVDAAGEGLWRWPCEDPAWFGLPSNKYVFAGAVKDAVVALDPESGEEKWRVHADPSRRAPSFDGVTLYFATHTHQIISVDANENELVATELFFPSAEQKLAANTQPIVVGGKLFFSSNRGKLHAFDVNDDVKELWTGPRGPTPAVVGDEVFVSGSVPPERRRLGESGDGVSILALKDGAQNGFMQTAVNLNTAPFVFGNQVFGCGDDLVVALDRRSLRNEWTVRLRGVQRLTVV
ncbi:MAG: PQQ-like beta-propeller repeat protein [Deltaproteobacteria bacterium]|nr:PQQ-like beta-propeller repeat protein [Deltaproteobacteria bacterium]